MITIQRAQELARHAARAFIASGLQPSFDVAHLNIWDVTGMEYWSSNTPNFQGPMTAPLNAKTTRDETTLYRALLRSFANYEALDYTCECGEVREDHVPHDIIAAQSCTKPNCSCVRFRSLATLNHCPG